MTAQPHALSVGRSRPRLDGRLPLVFALLLAVATGGLIYGALRQARELAPTPSEVVGVLVASSDIPVGTPLDSSTARGMFTITRVYADGAPADVVSPSASLEGRLLVEPLRAGDVLRGSVLGNQAPASVSGPRADLLPPGHVAIILDVTEHISVGGAVIPRDRVDLIATINVNSVPITQALLRDVMVLATGFHTRATPTSPETGPAPYSTLTLALVPQDAVTVQHLLAQNVRLALALRRPGEELESTHPETTAEIAQRYNLVPGLPSAQDAPTPLRSGLLDVR